MKQRLSVKILCATFAGICLVAGLAAGVNGIFNSVNSISGYKVNSAAGSSGQALCSDGTYFDTPCTPAGTGITALTGPVTASGSGSVATTITATGVTAGSYVGTNLTVNAAGQITAASTGATSGSNTNGFWKKDATGVITQWQPSAITVGNDTTITFPTAFTNASSVQISVPQISPISDVGYCFVIAGSITTTQFQAHSANESTDTCTWNAIGQ